MPKPSRLRKPLALALAATLALAAATAAAAKPPGSEAPPAPDFTNVSVHDPSVVVADGEFWVFGSHLASARSDDLIQWEQYSTTVSPQNPLFENVETELAETFAWAESSTLWAADVIQLEDGRYYMYYNACRGDSPRSAMGVAVSDSVNGPYEDLGIILRSGYRAGEGLSEAGVTYDARIHPNVVDPDTFFDAEGNLWMVYGSYSGGLFILQMDRATGMPLPGQGYGEHLMGGNHSRIEGPNIMFDENTGYYYLFTSFGGLDANGGYNVRVARSQNPDGPYVDAEGNPMSEVRSNPSLPLFDDATIEPFGVKLIGSFVFQREVGDPGTGPGEGYVSPGHNSTYVDPETGQMFIIFHARFPERGEQHEVRVHQMSMNSDGWPVIAPYRYAGEEAGKVKRGDVVGQYALIDHGKDITADIVRSTPIALNQNGTISGSVTGRWKLTGSNRMEVTIDGVDYLGVATRQWEPNTASWVMTFSVTSSAGVSLWGSGVQPMTDRAAVDAVVADLDLGDTSAVLADLTLPTVGTHGTTIAWASSNPTVVSPAGDVTRPEAGSGDATVTLTATITNGAVTQVVTFVVVVKEKVLGGLVAQYSFEGDLAEAAGRTPAGTVTGNRIDNTGGQVSYAPGVVGQSLVLDGASGVRLPGGLIAGSSYSVSLWLKPAALTAYSTTFFGARTSESWISVLPMGHDGVGRNTMVWSGTQWYDAGTGSRIPIGQWSHVALTVDDGDVTVYIDGVRVFAGTGFPDVFTTADAAFALGVNWWDTPYHGEMDEVRVYSSALSAADVAALAAG